MSAFGSAVGGIGFAITAHDLASKTLMRTNMLIATLGRTAGAAGGSMVKGFAGAVASMAAIGVGAAGLRGLFSAGKEAATFEFAMERVGIVTRATGKSFEALSDQARKLGLETEFTSTQVAEAMQVLAQAGFKAEEISGDLTAVVLDLTSAAGGMISTAEAASTIAVAWKLFGEELKDSRQAADMMTRATQISLLQFNELQKAFSGISGESMAFNQNYRDTLALITASKDFGFSAAGGANAVRIAMRNLISNNDRLQEATNGTVSVYDKLTGEFRSIIDVVDDLEQHWDKMNSSVQQRTEDTIKIFTKRGLRGISILTKGTFVTSAGEFKVGIDALRARLAELEDSEGAVQTAAQRMRETLLGTFTRIGGSLKNMLILIGQHLTPTVTKLAEKFFDATVEINMFIQSHPGLVKVGAALVALSSAFLVVSGAIGLVVSSYVVLAAMIELAGLGSSVLLLKVKALGLWYAILGKVQLINGIIVGKLTGMYFRLTGQTTAYTWATAGAANSVVMLNRSLAAMWALIWPITLVLALATAGILAFYKGWKLLSQGMKEGKVWMMAAGAGLSILAAILFPPIALVQVLMIAWWGLKKAFQATKNFLAPVIKAFGSYYRAVEPLFMVFKALKELLQNDFSVKVSTGKMLDSKGVFGIFTKIGSMLKWFSDFGKALDEIYQNSKEFMNKIAVIWDSTFGAFLSTMFRGMGEMVVLAYKFALGEIDAQEFDKKVQEITKGIGDKLRSSMGALISRIMGMDQADWDVVAEKFVKGFIAVATIMVYTLPTIFARFAAALLNLGIWMGGQIVRGVAQSIWDQRGVIWDSLVRLFKWLVSSMVSIATGGAVNPYAGGSGPKTREEAQVQRANRETEKLVQRSHGRSNASQVIQLLVDGRVLSEALVNENGVQQNAAGTTSAPGAGGRTGTGK